METNTIQNTEQILNSNEVLKLSALLYFQEALVKQEFETCTELVANAANFGASKEEIKNVITSFLRGDKPGGTREAKTPKNRVKPLLKETE